MQINDGQPARPVGFEFETPMRLPHSGMPYEPFMGELSGKRDTRNYLEIGVQTGKLLELIRTDRAVGVDPFFKIKHDVTARKREVVLHQCTSDRFFAAHVGDQVFDLVFIDGMHVFEYALRDFYNAERASHRDSLIVLHDCLPIAAPMIERNEADAVAKGEGSDNEDWWTGDVWKLIPILRAVRQDLRVFGVDCPPTGLLCITGLDPASDVLRQSYLKIVEKYAALPNTWKSVVEAFKGLTPLSSEAVLKGFDHSLFFRT